MLVKRILFTFVLSMLFLSNGALAVDISGEVVREDGSPVCGLILANGQNQFTCDPKGQFEFTDLPQRQNGTIQVQVFARNFAPFKATFPDTDTSFKTLVLERVGPNPVTDGLAVGSLEGTYELIRATVQLNDGELLDTAGASFSATGTMSITGTGIEQTIEVQNDNQGAVVNVAVDYEDLRFAIVARDRTTGAESLLMIIERGRKLVTAINATAYGGDFIEIDYWKRVSSGVTTASSSAEKGIHSQSSTTTSTEDVRGQIYSALTGAPGALLADIIKSTGLR